MCVLLIVAQAAPVRDGNLATVVPTRLPGFILHTSPVHDGNLTTVVPICPPGFISRTDIDQIVADRTRVLTDRTIKLKKKLICSRVRVCRLRQKLRASEQLIDTLKLQLENS